MGEQFKSVSRNFKPGYILFALIAQCSTRVHACILGIQSVVPCLRFFVLVLRLWRVFRARLARWLFLHVSHLPPPPDVRYVHWSMTLSVSPKSLGKRNFFLWTDHANNCRTASTLHEHPHHSAVEHFSTFFAALRRSQLVSESSDKTLCRVQTRYCFLLIICRIFICERPSAKHPDGQTLNP